MLFNCVKISYSKLTLPAQVYVLSALVSGSFLGNLKRCWKIPYGGLPSHPIGWSVKKGGIVIFLVASYYKTVGILPWNHSDRINCFIRSPSTHIWIEFKQLFKENRSSLRNILPSPFSALSIIFPITSAKSTCSCGIFSNKSEKKKNKSRDVLKFSSYRFMDPWN